MTAFIRGVHALPFLCRPSTKSGPPLPQLQASPLSLGGSLRLTSRWLLARSLLQVIRCNGTLRLGETWLAASTAAADAGREAHPPQARKVVVVCRKGTEAEKAGHP